MINIIKRAFGAIILQASALATPLVVRAQISGQLVPEGPQGIREIDNIIEVIQAAIRFILLVAFVLAFIFLIIGGIRWIVAGGDEKGVAGARGMITAALIGLVIVLVSFALIRLVEEFFGVVIISDTVSVPTVGSGTGGNSVPTN